MMKKLCWWIEKCEKSEKALEEIIFTFPCFVRVKSVDEFWQEVEVECREEDVKYIQRKLAKFV